MYPWTSGLANAYVDNLALLGAARAWDICLDYRYGNTVNSVKTDRRLGCVDVGQGVRVLTLANPSLALLNVDCLLALLSQNSVISFQPRGMWCRVSSK